TTGAKCMPTKLGTTFRCAPLWQDAPYYADAACTHPAIDMSGSSGPCPYTPVPPAALGAYDAPCGRLTLHASPTVHDGAIFQKVGVGVCNPIMRQAGATYFASSQAIDPETLPEIRDVTE